MHSFIRRKKSFRAHQVIPDITYRYLNLTIALKNCKPLKNVIFDQLAAGNCTAQHFSANVH